MKLIQDGPFVFRFHCPGCNCAHSFRVNAQRTSDGKGCWQFDGSMTAPTFFPSLLRDGPGARCHSYVENGRIRFLEDCDHALAGQTVDLPEVTA